MLNKGFTKSEVVIVICILTGLGLLGQYNFSNAGAKARDFERKEQMKSVANSINGYYINNKAYPPSGPNYTLKGCGDMVCPTEDDQGRVCDWPTGIAVTKWQCGKYSYMTLPKQPDNPSTQSEDAYRYARLSKEEFVLETCLELRSDNEARNVNESQTGLNEDKCPSGVTYAIRRSTQE